MAPPQQKRVRTGCLKCRARRRKCTEEKPRCQRCVTGGFECQYGTRLSFLQKNSFTVAPTPGEGSSSYRKVQFVGDKGASSEPDTPSEKRSEPDPAEPAGRSPSSDHHSLHIDAHRTLSPSDLAAPLLTPATESRSPELDRIPGQLRTGASHGHLPQGDDALGITPISPETQEHLGKDYEIALDVLLSLGNTAAGTDAGNEGHAMHSAPADEVPTDPMLLGDTSQLDSESQNAARAPAHIITEVREMQLLRYYRYEIAPWLDICDLGQQFGMSVPCLAGQDLRIHHNIIALAAATLPTASSTVLQSKEEVDALAEWCQRNPDFSPVGDQQSAFLCAVFTKARYQLQYERMGDAQELWLDHDLFQMMSSVATLESTAPLSASIYYLALRLELGSALINETPLSTPLHFSADFSMGWRLSDLATKVFICASELLVLCARAVNLSTGQLPINHLGQPDTVVTAWTTLAENLTSWYSHRPQECKPVAETDGSGETFPAVLFTSGAGVLGNQLYHTAMLLLLQNRPRTVKLGTQARPSATMSPLWHAQRICGIALNNGRRECWDPSLVSSFVVAAKSMTHEAQHGAVLDGLDQIAKLTGWSVSHHKEALRIEWGHEQDIGMVNG